MKGVILAGGYGTRFLPVTKTIPKEMLPLINKPSIECIIDEFAAAGITETLIITSRRKRCLDDYFDREVELETEFIRNGKSELLAKIEPAKMDIFFARQQTMNGTGHALLLSRPFVGNEPFVVAYPDDLHFAQGDQLPLAAQLSQKWQETGKTVLAGLDNPPNLERYGVLKLAADGCMSRISSKSPRQAQRPATSPASAVTSTPLTFSNTSKRAGGAIWNPLPPALSTTMFTP